MGTCMLTTPSCARSEVTISRWLLPPSRSLRCYGSQRSQAVQTFPTAQRLDCPISSIYLDCAHSDLEQLISKTKPRRVIVCMLYFIDEDTSVDSWASMALSALGYNNLPSLLQLLILISSGYNKDPSLLQLLIRTMYE